MPYVISCNTVTIAAGVTLTIAPGVVVKSQGCVGYGTPIVSVIGRLVMDGTATEPIVFTSASDAPGPGNWTGISFQNNATGSISNAILQYGGYGGAATILLQNRNSSVNISNNRITDSSTGILVEANRTDVVITGNTFIRNSIGVSVRGGAAPRVNQNVFYGNTSYAVVNADCPSDVPCSTTPTVDATNNYWGSSDGPSGAGPGRGDRVSFHVNFMPFIGNPPAPAPITYGPSGTPRNPSGSFAEPVNTATGNYYTSITDLTVPGPGLAFNFTRSYNSRDPYSGPLGIGWTHSYDIFASEDARTGVVTIKEGEGHMTEFVPIGGGAYTAQSRGVFDTLRKESDGRFILTRKNQTKLIFPPGTNPVRLGFIVDRNNNTQTLTYDGMGRLITIVDTAGRTFTLMYDANNRLTSLTDRLSRRLQYGYDANGHLVSFRDALGGVTQYAYDANHRMTSATDPRGNIYLQNQYDGLGRVTSQKNARNFTTTFEYDTPTPGTTTIRDPLANATRHVHDVRLRLISVVDAAGGITRYEYDTNNLRTTVTDALGRITRSTYDASGNLTDTTDPFGRTTRFTYDAQNNLLTTTDRLGRVTTFIYDARSNLLSTTDPLGGASAFTYDELGKMRTSQNARGFTTSFDYDASGNLVQTTDALGGIVQMEYDEVGRLISTTDRLGNTSSRSYDLNDRLLNVTDALGNMTVFAYDANGNRTRTTDANGKITQYEYDVTNKLTQVTDALGGVTRYDYDGNTDLIRVTDANRHATILTHDSLRRLKTSTDPLGFRKEYTYDAVANITNMLDGNNRTNRFVYDALNRLTSMTLADGTSVSYTYDEVGNRRTMTDARGVTTYSHDMLNRVLSVRSPDGSTVAYTYDAVGNRTSLTYPDGSVAQYQYDALNRLAQVTDSDGLVTGYTYDAAGNLTLTVNPNDTASVYTYDAANRLTGIGNSSGDSVLSSFSYMLDNVGNRMQVMSATGEVNRYGYDNLYRLTSWTAPSGQVTQYTYDPVGNRLTMANSSGTTTYTYDAADQMLTAGATRFTYDGNGNQITKTVGGTTSNYRWDPLNRLISVIGGTVNTQYQYDGDGNRVRQQIGASAYQYVNDAARALPVVLKENGPDGGINYVYGSSMISATSGEFQNFYQFDGLGSVATVTDSDGNLMVNYTYEPWGTLLNSMDPLMGQNKYKFIGDAVDPDTGLIFLRARYYDPALARFISRDPLSSKPGLTPNGSSYQYAASNPLRNSDPSGLVPQDTSTSTGTNLLRLSDRFAYLSTLSRKIGSLIDPNRTSLQVLSVVSSVYTYYREFQDPSVDPALRLGRASAKILLNVNPISAIPLAISGLLLPDETKAATNLFIDTTINTVVEGTTVNGIRVPGLSDFIKDVILDFGSNTRTVFDYFFN
jgi:RHS repeat-associated protein